MKKCTKCNVGDLGIDFSFQLFSDPAKYKVECQNSECKHVTSIEVSEVGVMPGEYVDLSPNKWGGK